MASKSQIQLKKHIAGGTAATFVASETKTISFFEDGDLCYLVETTSDGCGGSEITKMKQIGEPLDSASLKQAIIECIPEDTFIVNADGSATHTSIAGTVTTLAAPVSDSLVVNADGSVTHTAVDGTVVVIPAQTVSALTVAGAVITHTNGQGVAVTFDICAIVAANCNSPMILLPDGSVSYTDNAGTVTNIPAPVNSSLVANVSAGTFTHTSGSGVATVVDVCALAQICAPTLVANGGGQYTFNNGYGNTQIIDVNEIDMDINSMTVTGSVVNWTAEDNSTGSFDICAIVAANCNAVMNVNADGSVSYTDNAGNLTIIPAPAQSTAISVGGFTTTTHPDGTTHTSCDNPLKSVSVNGGANVSGDANGNVNVTVPDAITISGNDGTVTVSPNGTNYDLSVNHPADTVQTLCCIDAKGQEINVPVINNKAVIPFKPIIIRAQTSDGTFVAVDFDSATGIYTIPYVPLGGVDIDGNVIDDLAAKPIICGIIDQDDNSYSSDGNGNILVEKSNVSDNAAGVGGGVGTATITQSDGTVKDDAVCGVQSSVTEDASGAFGTVTQNDGSTKDFLCAGNDSIADNTAGVGGGVGTATITLPSGDVKDDAVCGVQSTTETDGVTSTTTLNDGSVLETCDNPVKDVLDADGNSVVVNGVAQLDAGAISGFTSNGNGTTSHDDGQGNSTNNIQEAIVDGGSNLVAADGVTIGPLEQWDGSTFDSKVDKIVTDNVIANIECVEGQEVITYCDGSQFCKRWQPREISVTVADSATGPFTDDGGLIEGESIPGTEAQLTVPDWLCPQRVHVQVTYSFTSEGGQGYQGTINTRPTIAINGGAVLNISDGGTDGWQSSVSNGGSTDITNYGEQEYHDDRVTPSALAGGSTIDFAIKLNTIVVPPVGTWDIEAITYTINYWECVMSQLP